MPRVLLLLFSLSVMTMMFIAKCGLNIDNHFNQKDGVTGLGKYLGKEHYEQLLLQKDESHKEEVVRLKEHIASLQRQLILAEVKSQNLSAALRGNFSAPKPGRANIHHTTVGQVRYFWNKLQEAEILKGLPLKTEYDVVPFNRFTLTRIYMVDPGLGKRVVEKPIGFKKKDIFEVVGFGLEALNRERPSAKKRYVMDDFLEGVYRTEPTTGTHYELYYRNIDNRGTTAQYTKVTVMRPFGPLQAVKTDQIQTSKEWINIIVPLSGRIETFRHFMDMFVQIGIKQDTKVYLTIVYFGNEGLEEAKAMMSRVSKTYSFKSMKLITVNEKFARGRGLQLGALNWKGGDVLMFLCDVDIVFGTDFLERCRLNTERGKRVYYPMVFSLYNPNVVYKLQDQEIPSAKDQLTISKDSGFWRDFGYGMACQYRSDFFKVKGFDEHITGWGGEDVFLYQKYVKSEYMVIRATDPGIFHLWHEKYCDPNLSSDQYRSCIRSKALNEASHAQLGLLAFKDEIDVHRSYKRINLVPPSQTRV